MSWDRKPSAISQRIAARLVREGELDGDRFNPDEAVLYRTHAGAWQRRQGALSWFLVWPDETGLPRGDAPQVGAFVAASVVLRWVQWRMDYDRTTRTKTIHPS